jgi:DNA polymerase IV
LPLDRSALNHLKRPHLLRETTLEHDDPDILPPLPKYLLDTYSCTRPTPLLSRNEAFISRLKIIKLWRKLSKDTVGVRAYSSAIAALAAYPYTVGSPQEVLRLPGCENKIAMLWQEWSQTGKVQEADAIEADPKFHVLNLFYEIWGVGEVIASNFYGKGWRHLDDVVEHGWNTLSRVQQIGVKYYDEFQTKIPRDEVTQIGAAILVAANKLHPGFKMEIVGGYSRGKLQSGDVDVVLTHPDESVTHNFIQELVLALETDGCITHTLTLAMTNSERGQVPLFLKSATTSLPRSGFDTLDKALVVWQDPNWPSKARDLADNPKFRNPNIHRRVDIIISPWKTAGCAVLGWTSATTFQRDLRRWSKKFKNLKFDSSGVRNRTNGEWQDFEAGAEDVELVDKEKLVFRGLGLEWRDPTERCTD